MEENKKQDDGDVTMRQLIMLVNSNSEIHHDKRMNECTIGTMNTRWKKNQTHDNGDLTMRHLVVLII